MILQTASAMVDWLGLGLRGMPVIAEVHLVASAFKDAICSILLSMR